MAAHQSVFLNVQRDWFSSLAGICRPDRGISSVRSHRRWRYSVLQGTRAVWVGLDLCDLHQVCCPGPPPRCGVQAEVGGDWGRLEGDQGLSSTD